MTHSRIARGAVALVVSATALHAQTLSDRIAKAPQPRVQFLFAAKPDVCGNGRSFIHVSENDWYGSWVDGDRRDPCAAGPVRVVLDRAGRDVVQLSTFVGPVPPPTPEVADLGRVAAADAASYFLGLAEHADGRVSRDAVLPAVIADSVDVTTRLLALARNHDVARETRRSALSWAARSSDGSDRAMKTIADALVSIAGDESDNQSVRQQALRALARLDHGAGTVPLVTLARAEGRAWVAREALAALTVSGDPRAREHLRDVVRAAELPDDVLAAAIRGVGGEYATAGDVKLVRDAYPRLPGNRSREAALSAVAGFGGSDNVRWLLTLAKDTDQNLDTRRRAVQYAYRGGASVADVIGIYDSTTDPQLKESALSVLAESGEPRATDKLMQIARTDENASMRRRAVNVLSRSSDERVKKFLSDLIVR